jgi:hypothetical protein
VCSSDLREDNDRDDLDVQKDPAAATAAATAATTATAHHRRTHQQLEEVNIDDI